MKVMALSGRGRGSVVEIPIETYPYFHGKGEVEAVLPTIDKSGSKGWTLASKWKDESQRGLKVDFDDRDQIPGVYKLSKELEGRDPAALQRFLAPFWGAVVGSLPEAIQEPLRKGDAPTIGETALGVGQSLSGYQLFIQPTKQFLKDFYGTDGGLIHIPKAWVDAAKMPTSGEGTAAAISALPVPLAPNIAQLTQKATTGDTAGALGEGTLLGGILFGPKILEGAAKGLKSTGLDEKIPAVSTTTREAYNLGLQRQILNELNKISLPGEVASKLRDVAGKQVSDAKVAEFDRIEKIKQEGRIDEYEAARTNLVRDMDAAYDGLAKEQARRVQTTADLEHLAGEVAGPRGLPPIKAAENAIEVANGVKGVVDEIETAAYEPAFQRAEENGVKTNLSPVGQAIFDATKSMIPAQDKLGVSSVGAKELYGAQKMGAHAMGLNEAVRALELGDVGALSANQQEAVHTLMQQMSEQGAVQMPFKVAVEAERGLSSMVRRMQSQHNPEYAPRIRLLRTIRNSLREQNDEALSQHPEVQELYDQAKRVTIEQNTVIGDRYVRKFFGDPRYRDAGEVLVQKLLSPNREKMARLVVNSLKPGPQAETAMSFIGEEDAARIAKKIADIAGQSEDARAGLRRTVVDEMMRHGTKTSSTPGVEAPETDFNRMETWLRDRPSAKILLGDAYDRVLSAVQQGARDQLAASDPVFDRTIQRLAAKRDQLERSSQRATVARRKLEEGAGKISPAPGAEAALKPMTESEFTGKVMSDPQFRSFVKRNASPAEQQVVLRNMVEGIIDNSMHRGSIGDPDAIIDMEQFGKEMVKAADALGDMGDKRSTYLLRGLGRAAERAADKVGLAAKAYFWISGFFKMSPRVTGRMNYGKLSLASQEILRQVEKSFNTMGPFQNDVVYASKDPALARILRQTLDTEPWKPGAATKMMQYLVALRSANRPVGKPKIMDEKTAQEILRVYGGDISLAADHAMAEGYTR